MSKEEDIVNNAVNALTQEPAPVVKPFWFNDNHLSLDEIKNIYKRLEFITKEDCGKYCSVIMSNWRGSVSFSIKYKKKIISKYIAKEGDIIRTKNEEKIQWATSEAEFMILVEKSVTLFRANEIIA